MHLVYSKGIVIIQYIVWLLYVTKFINSWVFETISSFSSRVFFQTAVFMLWHHAGLQEDTDT
jgi:hypothetical protein